MNRHYKRWHEREDDYLKSHYTGDNLDSIAADLHRSPKSVRTRASMLGLTDHEMSHYYSDPTIKVCLNCPYPRCKPTVCDLVPRQGRFERGPRKKKEVIA